MRILFITSRFPYPPLKGDKIRSYYPIKLMSQTNSIDLLSFTEEEVLPAHLDHMHGFCRKIDVVPLKKPLFTAMLALGVFSPVPSQVLCYKSLRMMRLIRDYTREEQYHIVHLVCGRIVGYARQINGIPKVIDWIDAMSLSTERMYRTERFLPKKLIYYLEWKKIKRYEKNGISACDFSFITSPVDRAYLGDQIDEVIANGVDTSTFRPRIVSKDLDLVFTGNMGYYPNIKAVQFFCRKVFPLVLRKRPGTTFHIVGINPSRKVRDYHDGKNVFVTGYVEDLTELLNRAKVFVAPLQSGAGIQNKILEAMACSLPVISTSYGNAGIIAREDHEILIRDKSNGFADAILDLLTDVSKRRKLGKNGHELIKKRFSWESKADRLDKIYTDILNKKAVTLEGI